MIFKIGSTLSDFAAPSPDFGTQAPYMSGPAHLPLSSRKLKKLVPPLYLPGQACGSPAFRWTEDLAVLQLPVVQNGVGTLS